MLESDKCSEKKKDQSKRDGVCWVYEQWVEVRHNFKLSGQGRPNCKDNI